MRSVTLLLATLLPSIAFAQAPPPAPDRAIALTFDDLPAMSAMDFSASDITAQNAKLLAILKENKIPAIGFVNEERLYKTGETDARIAVLSAWLDAGMALGNHTFSHTSLNHAELRDWEDDVVQGESVTRMLQRPRNLPLEYLRFPFLDEGPDLITRREARAFLTHRGYRVAPVTVDGMDWFFADLYDDAHKHNDPAAQQRITAAWLQYNSEELDYTEALCRSLLGYEPKQVFLMHDTHLEADHLPELLAILRKHGYHFISLGEALTDPAYSQPDDYVSDVGATTLEHWASTRSKPVPPSSKPQIPDWAKKKHDSIDADMSQ